MNEELLVSVLKTLCPRVFPDVAPPGTEQPYVTFQNIGGEPLRYLENTPANKRGAVIQVSVWSDRRAEANSLMRQIEDALCESTLFQAEARRELVSAMDDTGEIRGAHQDFLIFATR